MRLTTSAMSRMAQDLREGFRGYAGRYLLAAFSVSIGIMVLALLVLIVTGLQNRVNDITHEFGADVASVIREDLLSGPIQGLSIEHFEMIRGNYPDLEVAPIRIYEAMTLGSPNPITVIATGPDLMSIRGWVLREGRNLDDRDVLGKDRVLVASRRMQDEAGWRPGHVVIVDKEPFFVAGLVEADTARADSGSRHHVAMTGERFALIPWSTAPIWRGENHETGRRLQQIMIKGRSDAAQVVKSIRSLFAQPGIDPGEISWVTARQLVADLERLQKTILMGVGSIALLCLLLGGTTLMSLMVLNVRERIPEIGLRLSLGASRRQISTLFVVEAMLVTSVAGIVGTAIAHAMVHLLNEQLPVSTQASPLSLLMPTTLALLLGALFSWWPATLASRITPSEAIRSE